MGPRPDVPDIMKLAKNFSIYFLTFGLHASIPFLLMPILTAYLSQEDYGTMSLFSASVRVLVPLISLGSVYAISVEYFKREADEFPTFFSSALFVPMLSFFLMMGIALAFREPLGNLLELPAIWIIAIPIAAIFVISEEILLALIRNKDRTLTFAILRLGRTIVEFSLVMLFVVLLLMNWEGRALGYIFSYSLLFVISLIFFFKWRLIKFKVDKQIIWATLAFGLPLIPERLSTFALNLSDRYFLAKMVNLADVGLYTVGSQIGSIVLIVVNALAVGYTPWLYAQLKDITPEKKIRIVRLSYILFAILLVSVSGLMIVKPLIFQYWVNKNFAGSTPYVFWIAMGYAFWGVYLLMQGYLIFLKKTQIIMWMAILMIVLNLSFNYLFIRNYGTLGAAYATTLSYFFIALISVVMAYRVYPMPWGNFAQIFKR